MLAVVEAVVITPMLAVLAVLAVEGQDQQERKLLAVLEL
tara:strand:+ start:525 stop:641 length:117 start_codon:yes stop_codon:yes gene_type:complete